MTSLSVLPFSERVIAALHREALSLADDTNAYFSGEGRADAQTLPPRAKLHFTGEALKAGTRVMQVIAWAAARTMGPLADSPPSTAEALDALPARARQLIVAGMDLHQRASRMVAGVGAPIATDGTARGLFQRLERVR